MSRVKGRRIYPYLIGATALLIIILWLKSGGISESAIPTQDDTSRQSREDSKAVQDQQQPPKVKVSVFYETLCPDSIAFIVNQLWPVYKTVGSIMDIDLVPYGKASYTASGNTWTFQCQHGKKECHGNKIHSCTLDLYPDTEKSLAFIFCSMSSHDPVSASETCAYKNSMDWVKISLCADGDLGSKLLHANGVRTESLQPRLVFVPWILIDNNFTELQLQASLDNLLNVVCNAYKGTKPSECPA